MIQTFQSFRGIFVAMIFLSHYPLTSGMLGYFGDVGVAFFFMLSGFLLYLAHCRKETRFVPFMKRRLIRVYPLHLLCFAAGLLLGLPGLKVMLANLLLLQSWIPKGDFYFSVNAVSWYLSSLLCCYGAYPFLQRLLNRSPRGFVACLILAVATLLTCGAIAGDKMQFYLLYIFPPARVADFAFGMLLCRWVMRVEEVKTNAMIEIGVVVLMALAVAAGPLLPEVLTFSFWWWIPEGLLICLFFRARGAVAKVFSVKPLVWFGDVSFSFFMLHQLIIRASEIVCQKLQLEQGVGMMLLIFCISTLCAWACERLFVLPADRWLKSHLMGAGK